MTPERFETLAEAFGGEVSRWPEAEREAAAKLMADEPAWAQGVLSRADDLDSALAAFSPPRAAAGLMDRIVATAPRPRSRRWIGWLVPVGMGAGLAAACAAGVMLGAQVAAPAPASDPDGLITAVGDDDFSLYLDEEA